MDVSHAIPGPCESGEPEIPTASPLDHAGREHPPGRASRVRAAIGRQRRSTSQGGTSPAQPPHPDLHGDHTVGTSRGSQGLPLACTGVGRGGRASPTSRAGGVVECQRGLAGGQAAQHVGALGHGGGRVVVHLLGGDVVVDDGLPVLQRGRLGVATDEIGRVQVRVGGVRGQVPGQVIGSGRWERDMGSEVRHTHTLTASPPTPRTEPRPPRRQLFP